MRIGTGFDVHKLKEGVKFMLGGVEIPFIKGAVGHSDADVLMHAICDALLGAAALGDIGVHFPDDDEKYKDISGIEILAKTYGILKSRGFRVINVDSVVVLENPKISKFIYGMRQNIAGILEISVDDVSVKATTTEGLGFIGRGEGVAAKAVVLISNED